MKNRTILFLLFVLMVGVQWFVPTRMINQKHSIAVEGRQYKFQMSPLDVEDPFRGKYLQLRFTVDHYKADSNYTWKSGDVVYVLLKKNAQDFVRVSGLTSSLPNGDDDFVKATVRHAFGKDSLQVYIDYPFDRYYINDNIPDTLEQVLLGNLKDSSTINYALVRIKSGEAVLEEVYIDSVSISEWYDRIKK
ncbi:GDYXXLXY domain-containing protein [Membranicola marinus]|uniref:GDYXXLXY domain-containing protein n=1 Tax=Membranihabitans marinus TaxID=1227546 RepID=A0A953HPV8_9BACT|nr:GDYXXLXY domain-containing protein [Membranihabitans marinus]MBY5959587.1 GDYXXLXY domain-containing protein [Membranihabitans marinus]